MLNAPKPVHINVSGIDANGVVGLLAGSIYSYEAVPAGGNNAVRITIPGMGAGADPPIGSRSAWRRASWITITNMDVTDNLEISFDNGNNFMTLGASQTFTASLAFRFFFVRGVGAVATSENIECIVGINGPN
tara:strand:+ start:291 stop:689 length:399 start_codon:yes stop_codon:yes gene_type:complete